LAARVSKARRLQLAFILFSIPLLSAQLPDWMKSTWPFLLKLRCKEI
jgi:hypothetical protein